MRSLNVIVELSRVVAIQLHHQILGVRALYHIHVQTLEVSLFSALTHATIFQLLQRNSNLRSYKLQVKLTGQSIGLSGPHEHH